MVFTEKCCLKKNIVKVENQNKKVQPKQVKTNSWAGK